MPQKEMVIFTKTFDFLQWLLPMSNHFPRNFRHTFTQRLLNSSFDFIEKLEEANSRRGAERQQRLLLADEYLRKVKFYLRFAAKMGWLNSGQYQHVSKMVDEIGRLLGGWQKAT